MTRSDIILEVNRITNNPNISPGNRVLITKMHRKIEEAYRVVFVLEGQIGDDALAQGLRAIGAELRKALERD